MSRLPLLLLFVLPFLVVSAVKASSNVSRSQFPKGFLFGTASSAYQVSSS
jgi:beta-glucosidase